MQLFKSLACNLSNSLHAILQIICMKIGIDHLHPYYHTTLLSHQKNNIFFKQLPYFYIFFKQLLYYYIFMYAFLQTLYMQTNIANYLYTSRNISTTTILLHVNTIPNQKQHTHWGILSNSLYAINH